MKLLKMLFSGDDDQAQVIADELGPDFAQIYVNEYNNACEALGGFEPYLGRFRRTKQVFLAPLVSQSHMVH